MINVSFSGGRSSAMMLHILKENYPLEDIIITFANTGKEREETLDFVHEIETKWNLSIVWLEAVFEPYTKGSGKTMRDCISYKIVNYETASRKGEPFSALIKFLKYVPNRVKRICTNYLKVWVIEKYMIDNFGEEYETALGIRYDEPKRIRKHKDKLLPLNDFKIMNKDVRLFWKAQDFDLELKDYEGNCDLCFLKGINKRRTILKENPHLADWWINEEEKAKQTFHPHMPVRKILNRSKGVNFKMYKDFFESNFTQQELFDDISCFCGD